MCRTSRSLPASTPAAACRPVRTKMPPPPAPSARIWAMALSRSAVVTGPMMSSAASSTGMSVISSPGLSSSSARTAPSAANWIFITPPSSAVMLPDRSMTSTRLTDGKRSSSWICMSTGRVSSSGVAK